MAESKTKNWADMDHDEEEEQEDIGLQGGKKDAAANEEDKKEEGATTAAEQTGDRPKRIKKDYGAAYDPNYKKNRWRKGAAQTGGDKNIAPAIPRQKNERGDYVVTSFVIPERKEAVKAGDKVSAPQPLCLMSLVALSVCFFPAL